MVLGGWVWVLDISSLLEDGPLFSSVGMSVCRMRNPVMTGSSVSGEDSPCETFGVSSALDEVGSSGGCCVLVLRCFPNTLLGTGGSAGGGGTGRLNNSISSLRCPKRCYEPRIPHQVPMST